jgi:hypothetical protein
VKGIITWTPAINQIGINNISVRATNSAGSVEQTFSVTVVGPIPPTPSAPIASDIAETTLKLTWNAVTSPAGTVSYRVYGRTGLTNRFVPVAATFTGASAIVTNLLPGTTRDFYVTAIAGGSESLPSPLVSATTLQPAAPSTLTATNVTQTSLTLTWQATASTVPIVGYRLYESGFLRQNNITALTTSVTGLLPGTSHPFEIRAFDGSGIESKGSLLTVNTLAPPVISHQSPTFGRNVLGDQVVAVAGEPMMVIFATTPLTSTAGLDYAVSATGLPVPTFSIVSGPVGMTVDPVTGVVSWIPTVGPFGVSNATVRASNSEGNSDLTFSVTAYPAGSDLLVPTNVPTYQSLTNITQTGASFTWIAANDNKGVVGYNIYAQTPPTNCARGAGCSGGPVVKVGVAGPDASYTITGLQPATGYAIYFQAFDAAGNVANEPLGRVLPLLQFTTLP